ncbi:NAD(P)H-binding protein [Streptomyces sp. H10-C2]|uniref:NmrA family NAD(P)-binding protein n=1 Tax=unclassified Streptomyces TaxID=2593676 RepID=UPI0024B9C120|nr:MULTISPECIES: NAD(P)H-binding protein [unclassified Streptomyces]MDJ0345195.1 NAD(P)H-binding protein [Streptomyces sp. PH10-H1]MDJ0374448.1 NAD(P)H-binding protein [Streptomyces sp. H10-C2]
MTTTLVTGSRGRVGRTLIGLLHEQGFKVRAASSEPDELALPDGVPDVKLSFADPHTFPDALAGVGSVFLYADSSHIEEFIKVANDAGVQHVVLLSSSAVLGPNAANDPIARQHLEVEDALKSSALPCTFLRPGAFASNALYWSWPLRTTGALNLPYPGSHTDAIHESDIAEAALAILKDPSLRGGAYTLTGPDSITFGEQVALLSRTTGRQLRVDAVTRDAWKAEVAEYMHGPFADALLDYWQSNDGRPVDLTHTVEELTGHPARGFAVWAEEYAAEFVR